MRDTNQSEVGRRNGGTMLSQQGSERALLCFFMERLHALDVDALVGHNVAAFDLDVLLHRMQHHKVGAPVRCRHWRVDITLAACSPCYARPVRSCAKCSTTRCVQLVMLLGCRTTRKWHQSCWPLFVLTATAWVRCRGPGGHNLTAVTWTCQCA